jgi:hypothetical protein
MPFLSEYAMIFQKGGLVHVNSIKGNVGIFWSSIKIYIVLYSALHDFAFTYDITLEGGANGRRIAKQNTVCRNEHVSLYIRSADAGAVNHDSIYGNKVGKNGR